MKRFAVVLAVLILAASSLAAVDLSLVVGGQGTYGELNIGSNSDPSYKFSVDAELDMDFDKGHGMLVGMLLSMQDIDLSVGYAYQTDISSSCDFILGAGVTLGLKEALGLDFFVTADFDFTVTNNMFVRVGTGFMTDLGQLGEGYGKNPNFIIPLPYIGFGWDF